MTTIKGPLGGKALPLKHADDRKPSAPRPEPGSDWVTREQHDAVFAVRRRKQGRSKRRPQRR